MRSRKNTRSLSHSQNLGFTFVLMPDGTVQRVSAQNTSHQIAVEHQEGAKDNRR